MTKNRLYIKVDIMTYKIQLPLLVLIYFGYFLMSTTLQIPEIINLHGDKI